VVRPKEVKAVDVGHAVVCSDVMMIDALFVHCFCFTFSLLSLSLSLLSLSHFSSLDDD